MQCGEAMARRRKEDGRLGSASRGMVRRLGRFFSRKRPRVSQIERGGLISTTPRGQPWTSAVTLSPGRNGLSARRMAVLSMFRVPSLCRHVHRELLRSVLLGVTPIMAATACHQRNYVERYSRFKKTLIISSSSWGEGGKFLDSAGYSTRGDTGCTPQDAPRWLAAGWLLRWGSERLAFLHDQEDEHFGRDRGTRVLRIM
jgi:hypothetical protein